MISVQLLPGPRLGLGMILRAVDVSDPARPRDLGSSVDCLDYGGIVAGELVFRDGLLYVAALDEGFWILHPVAPGDPSPTATRTAAPMSSPTATRTLTTAVGLPKVDR